MTEIKPVLSPTFLWEAEGEQKDSSSSLHSLSQLKDEFKKWESNLNQKSREAPIVKAVLASLDHFIQGHKSLQQWQNEWLKPLLQTHIDPETGTRHKISQLTENRILSCSGKKVS